MIIGVMGQARAGKDTFADYLVSRYGFIRIALADPIKRICMDIYQMTEEQLWGDDKEKPDMRYPIEGKGFMSPRVACQVIGTEVGRNLYTNTWVDYFKDIAQDVLENKYNYSKTKGRVPKGGFIFRGGQPPKGVICSDIRFKNEVKAVQGMGGKVIRLKRSGKDGSVGIAGHASEAEQKTIPDNELDAVIDVQEGLENFYRQIDSLLERLPMQQRLKVVT